MLNPGVTPTNSGIRRPGAPPDRKVGSMSNYMARTPVRSLAAGQIIRGEVTDLRNNEITITLEDNTSVTGKMAEGANLAIGERASFLVTNIQPDNIMLELVKKQMESSEDVTIRKALDEAGLPQTEKNQSIVQELLENNMPIHKQSIMNIVTQSFQFPKVSVQTLVAMNRMGITVTENLARQFENCRTREESLASGAQELANSIVSYFQDGSPETTPDLARKLFEIMPFDETGTTEGAQSFTAPQNSPDIIEGFSKPVAALAGEGAPVGRQLFSFSGFQRLAGLLNPAKANGNSAQAAGNLNTTGNIADADRQELEQLLRSFIKGQLEGLEKLTEPEKPMNPMAFYHKTPVVSEELQNLLSSLHQFSDKTEQMFNQEPMSLKDAIALFQEGKNLADDIDFYYMDEARNHFMEKNPSALEGADANRELYAQLQETLQNVPMSADAFSSALLERMESDFSAYLSEKGTIASMLSGDELRELSSILKDFPMDESFAEQLQQGDVTPNEFISFLRNTAFSVSNGTLYNLISTPLFAKIFEQPFASMFFIEPKDLEKPGAAQEFYDQTYERLHKVSHALTQAKAGDSGSNMLDMAGKKSGNMQEQMEFIKSFNEMFTFLQIPVKLKNQMKSADLYVYTKKEAMREHPDKLSVLLHLDMDHLGPLDIYVALNHTTVKSKIFCEDADTRKFLSSQVSSLQAALNLKGYSFESEVEEREKPFDFVKDFIQKEEKKTTDGKTPKGEVKRYTFDIRA